MRRLARAARLRRAARGASTGLFFGLLPGLLLAGLSGTIALPYPPLALAVLCALAGLAAGAGAGWLRRLRRADLLISADHRLAARELLSTALEIAERGERGIFSAAILSSADGLLSRTRAAASLGRPRLPFLPFVPVLAMLVALALIFPLDFRKLLPHRPASEMGQIGEDLSSFGEQLQNSARSRGLDRSLALGQQLAQLGRDLADRSIQRDDALDRIAELEQQLSQELNQLGQAAPRSGSGARPGGGQTGAGPGGTQRSPGTGGSDAQGQELKDLQDALKRLQDARRGASPNAGTQPGSQSGGQGSSGQSQSPQRGTQPNKPAPGQGRGSGASGEGGQSGGNEPGIGSGGSEGPPPPGGSASSGIGSTPAPDTRGPPSFIPPNSGGLARVPGSVGEGDSARLLVRSLPEWTGSKLPEDRVLRQYQQQAESALARDEVPTRLKEYVKGYFTTIGMEPGPGTSAEAPASAAAPQGSP